MSEKTITPYSEFQISKGSRMCLCRGIGAVKHHAAEFLHDWLDASDETTVMSRPVILTLRGRMNEMVSDGVTAKSAPLVAVPENHWVAPATPQAA